MTQYVKRTEESVIQMSRAECEGKVMTFDQCSGLILVDSG